MAQIAPISPSTAGNPEQVVPIRAATTSGQPDGVASLGPDDVKWKFYKFASVADSDTYDYGAGSATDSGRAGLVRSWASVSTDGAAVNVAYAPATGRFTFTVTSGPTTNFWLAVGE